MTEIEKFVKENLHLVRQNKWKEFWAKALPEFGYTYELGQLARFFDYAAIDCKPDFMFQNMTDRPITIMWNETDFITNQDIDHTINKDLYDKFSRQYDLATQDTEYILANIKDLNPARFIKHLLSVDPIGKLKLSIKYNVTMQMPVVRISVDTYIIASDIITTEHFIIIPGEGYAYSESAINKKLDWIEDRLRTRKVIK